MNTIPLRVLLAAQRAVTNSLREFQDRKIDCHARQECAAAVGALDVYVGDVVKRIDLEVEAQQ